MSKSKENFYPINNGKVLMYSCGPTVYDYAHIGNFRSFLFSDILRRMFESFNYEVKQIINITDVGHMVEDNEDGEDKMSVAQNRIKSQKEKYEKIKNPNDPYEISEYFINSFIEDCSSLNMLIIKEKETNLPRATNHIQQMHEMINLLLNKGYAYITNNGSIYFNIKKFNDYGKLSGNKLNELKSGMGGRVNDHNTKEKINHYDFLLWKSDKKHIMKWDSPWGVGYPGWHIECSAMAKHNLNSEEIDIHTGGEDNIFPHHECEIAQTRCAYGKEKFARYWLHTRFLMVDGSKMSKSKGNFYTIKDMLNNNYGIKINKNTLRFELIKTHYRSNANLTQQSLNESSVFVGRFKNIYNNLKAQFQELKWEETSLYKEFLEELSDDVNMPGAISKINVILKKKEHDKTDYFSLMGINKILGLKLEEDDNVKEMVDKLIEARSKKDYITSDSIRDKLITLGYKVKISKNNVELL